MRKIFTSCWVLALASSAFSQPSEEWVQRYSGSGTEVNITVGMVADRFGNVYITGITNAYPCNLGCTVPPPDAENYITVKYNAAGTLQWAVSYNGPANAQDNPRAIAVDFSGNVYVTGWSTGSGTRADITTIKYNSSGVQQWVARHNGGPNYDDVGSGLTVDASGNVYVTGSSEVSGSPLSEAMVTIKYDATGAEQWVQSFHDPSGIDSGRPIAVDLTGNVYVAVAGVVAGVRTGVLIKYNSSGGLLWMQRSETLIEDIILDFFGNVYMTAQKISLSSGIDYETTKYSTSGVKQWSASFNGAANLNDEAIAITLDFLGNVYVTGTSDGGGFNYNYATVKYNNAGMQQWSAIYDGPDNTLDAAADIAVDLLGNVYVTGNSESGRSGHAEIVTVKYTAAGVQQWPARHSAVTYESHHAIAIALNGPGGILSNILGIGTNIYVAGRIDGGHERDMLTIKYSQPLFFTTQLLTKSEAIALHEQTAVTASLFKLSTYPDPVSGFAKIRFDLPVDGKVSLTAYDALGTEVARITKGEQKAGSYSMDYDASHLANGVYSWRMVAETATSRIVKTIRMVVAH